MGIGIFWGDSLAASGAVPPSNFFLDGTAYANARSAYNSIINDTTNIHNKIPLEDSGGSGTLSAHWENNFRTASYTGSGGVAYPGLSNELMVGSISRGASRILSGLSVKTLVDFGYKEVTPGNSEGKPTMVLSYTVGFLDQNNIKLVCSHENKPEKIATINAKTGEIIKKFI